MKSVLIKLLYIIIIPIIIYDLILIIQSLINPNVTPSVFGIKTFSIVSGSMAPTINIDDIILVKEVKAEELDDGDIISFNVDGEIVTHRIMNIQTTNNSSIYYTKGDSNIVGDAQQVRFYQIEGKYLTKIPKAGKVLSFLKNKIVFGVITVILIICYRYDKKIVSKRMKRRAKRKKYDRKKEEEIDL